MLLNLSPSTNGLLDSDNAANAYNGKHNTSCTLTVYNACLLGRAGPI